MYYHPIKKINQEFDAVIEPENYHIMLERFESGNAEHGGGHDSEQEHETEHNSEHETEIDSHDEHGH